MATATKQARTKTHTRRVNEAASESVPMAVDVAAKAPSR